MLFFNYLSSLPFVVGSELVHNATTNLTVTDKHMGCLFVLTTSVRGPPAGPQLGCLQ